MDFEGSHSPSPSPSPGVSRASYYVYKAKKGGASQAKAEAWFNNRDLKRKKRIAKYKWYDVEGKAKSSIKKGFCWFKHTWRKLVDGF